MVNDTPNLGTDFVKDMLAESPAKESKAVMADRIPKLPKYPHWAVKAVVEPYPEDRQEVMALMALPFLGMMGGDARFLYRNQEVHHLGFECCLVGEQSIGKSALTRMQNVLISKVIEADNETRAKSDEYADECIAAGDGKEKPKDPHYGTRMMMPSTTKAQLFQNLKNLKGKRAIITCPEIDSLNVANNWSRDAGANERLMFDTEVGGQDTQFHILLQQTEEAEAAVSPIVPIEKKYTASLHGNSPETPIISKEKRGRGAEKQFFLQDESLKPAFLAQLKRIFTDRYTPNKTFLLPDGTEAKAPAFLACLYDVCIKYGITSPGAPVFGFSSMVKETALECPNANSFNTVYNTIQKAVREWNPLTGNEVRYYGINVRFHKLNPQQVPYGHMAAYNRWLALYTQVEQVYRETLSC